MVHVCSKLDDDETSPDKVDAPIEAEIRNTVLRNREMARVCRELRTCQHECTGLNSGYLVCAISKPSMAR